jgi:phosphatidylglycerophosphatase C
LFDPAICVKILGWLTTIGVSKEDAELSASTVVKRACELVVRPAILAEIRRHQAAGRGVVILTGSLEPVVGPFCRSLGCECIGTPAMLDKTNTYYTGELGEPNIATTKVAHVQQSACPIEELYGYGNSKSDIPFLCLTGNPYAVAAG